MLGRTEILLDPGKATEAFQLSRALAVHGAGDPLGLAVASYGEEARIHFDRANALLIRPPDGAPPGTGGDATGASAVDPAFPGYALPPQVAGTYKREMHAAAVLYAEQAARDSDSGTQSLRIIASNLVAEPDRMDLAVSDPILERLLAAFALAWMTDDVSAVSTISSRKRDPTRASASRARRSTPCYQRSSPQSRSPGPRIPTLRIVSPHSRIGPGATISQRK
jgi:hypothetical protein